MSNITPDTKLHIFRYLNGDMSLSQFEQFVTQNLNLEQELGEENYYALLTFDYRDKNASRQLEDFLLNSVVAEGEFETWKLTERLKTFIDNPDKAKELLDEFYRLYCGHYNSDDEYVNGYRFLGHLGLNYFYWMDVGYIQASQPSNWLDLYNKYLREIPFYHEQLKPIAERVLKALVNHEIRITGRGRYVISEEIRREMESDTILQLRHPE